MEIIFNTDKNIKGSESLIEKYTPEVQVRMKRYDEYLTRIEVFFVDENGRKEGGDDKRCTLEARLKGRPAEAVTHKADTLMHALSGAIEKMHHRLEKQLGHRKDH